MVLHEGSNITASFAERLEFHENLTFPHALWINNDKLNKTTRIKTTYILKMLYTGCSTNEAISLLSSWITQNFESKWLLHIHFGLIVANQNEKTRIRKL